MQGSLARRGSVPFLLLRVCLQVSRSNIHESIEYVKQIEAEVQKAMVIE